MPAASALAGALLASLRRDGIEPDPGLRLLQLAPSAPAGEPLGDPGALGTRHEQAATDEERSRRGAWYTPAWLASAVVEQVLVDRPAAARGPVLDPACGGGAFLLAAVERLRSLGWGAAEAVAHVRGRDVDPVAVAVTEASLWWWSARQGEPARPRVEVGDSLLHGPSGRTAAVVGNPPFLGQLRSRTAHDAARRDVLRQRFGDAIRAYTDPAWLFALWAVEEVVSGGRVGLVEPQSFLAARDAGEVRDRIDRRARLLDTLVEDGTAFDADVAVCVPILQRSEPHPDGNDWVGALAEASGIPSVELPAASTLAEIASTHAGFRDEYYGTAAAVREGGDGMRLVTAGGIDPLCLLGRPQRFAGERWADPRVVLAGLAGRARRWAELQQAAKVLVATQTRVLEAVADPDGHLLGSVPVVVVRPHEPRHVWRLAAALHAPAASAWLLRHSAGTALSADACRPTAALLAALPLPADEHAWDRAAELAERSSRGEVAVAEVARAADAAYGVSSPSLHGWWDRRRPRR